MSTRNINVLLTGNATSLRGALMAAGREVDTFTNKVDNASKTGISAGKLLGAAILAAGILVATGLGYAVVAAAKFDTQMRNVQSITKVTDAELGAMGDTLIKMSTRLPQSAATLAEGLYQIASSGFAGADGLKVLEASAIAASAGLTTTEVSARAITSVLNAYGREAGDATDVSDVLFQTVNLGVVSFEELAGTIGDVVGTAAAATVGVDELGSAIATMTLSGISASEAGTSLNRLIQTLIDPSEDLAQALRDVGYESGAQALQVDTLSVVMEKLRVASGGNIETLLKWFPEIRAARGALALMSNEGKNYAKVVAEIESEEARSGATRAALNEQLKAVTAQWQLFVNWVNAGAITLGSKMLPSVIDVLNGLKDLGQAGIPVVLEALQRVAPFFEAVWRAGENLVDVAGDLLQVIGPVAGALVALGGIAVIEFLERLAMAAASVTGFFADHPAIIQAVAVVLAVQLVPALAATTAGFLASRGAAILWGAAVVASNVIAGIQSFIAGIQVAALNLNMMRTAGLGAAGSMTALRGAMTALTGLAVAGALIAVTAAVNAYRSEVKEAEEDGKSWAKSFAGDFDPAKVSMAELEGEITRLGDAADEMQHHANNALNPFLDDRLKTARDELHATAEPLIEIRDRAKMLQEELGITSTRALELATDQEFMASATDGATGALDKEAAAALEAQTGLKDMADQLRGMFDPIFGAQNAINKLADAQQAVNEAIWANNDAIEDNNVSQEEMARLNQAAVEAAVDYQGALLDLKAAVADGSVQFHAAVQTLNDWAAAGIITEEQARQAADEIGGLRGQVEATNGKQAVVGVVANTLAAEVALANFRYMLDTMPRVINVTTNVTGVRPNRTDQRWGGVVHAYADGGITPAHITRDELIKYGEPETGGEAFIPRFGNPGRSTAVLTEAASWYGFQLVKMARGGIFHASGSGAGATVIAPAVHIHVTEDVTPMGLARVERAAKRAASDAVAESLSRTMGGRT